MIYTWTVTQDFLDIVEKKAREDTRPYDEAYSQWGFEVAEYALGKIQLSGHEWCPEHCPDTFHDYFGCCDLKYLNKHNTLTISRKVKQWIEEGNIDTFIPWRYISRHPYKHLQLGEKIKFELLMYIDAQTVYNNLMTKGKKYEYLCS